MSKAGNCDLPPDDVGTLGVTWETSTFSISPHTFILFPPHTLYRTFSLLQCFSATRFSNDSVSHFFVIRIIIHTLRLSCLPPVLRLPKRHPTANMTSKDPQSNIPASSRGSWSSFLKVSVHLHMNSMMYSLRKQNL